MTKASLEANNIYYNKALDLKQGSFEMIIGNETPGGENKESAKRALSKLYLSQRS